MSEVRNIPRLRFPEFKEEWIQNSLGDICSFSKGKGISKSDIIDDGVYECIRYGELYTHYNEVIDKVISKTNFSDNPVFSKINDVIIPASGETALDIATASCVLKKDVLLGGDLNIIRTKVNGVFLSYYLNNKRKKEIARLSQGNSVVHVYPSQLKTLKILIPHSDEFDKIADFLTVVDKRIELLEKKKTLLETYKKGVMKKIFNQEIRFKDDNGNDFPVWREMKLGNVLTEYISKTKVNNQHDVLSSTIEKIYRQSEYFNHQVASKDNTGYKVLKLNQLVFSPQNIWMGNINVNTEFEKGIVSPSYKIYDFKPGYDYMYFKDFLKQPKMLFEYTQSSEQGASVVRRNLNLKLFLSIPIKVPSLDEQIKISNFLSSIDNQIERLDTQIDKSKSWKKGLLQKMFV